MEYSCSLYKAYNSLLARILFLRDNKFANISENQVLAKISGFTVLAHIVSLMAQG